MAFCSAGSWANAFAWKFSLSCAVSVIDIALKEKNTSQPLGQNYAGHVNQKIIGYYICNHFIYHLYFFLFVSHSFMSFACFKIWFFFWVIHWSFLCFEFTNPVLIIYIRNKCLVAFKLFYFVFQKFILLKFQSTNVPLCVLYYIASLKHLPNHETELTHIWIF